jgi:hypothetical protein
LNLAAGNAYDYLTGLNVGVANLFSYVGGAVTYNVAACV